jgi:hypothetical protein
MADTDLNYDPRRDPLAIPEANAPAKDGWRRVPLVIHGQVINGSEKTNVVPATPPLTKE